MFKEDKMNEKDMKIIAHLRTDARMPLTKMSKKTHIPVSTIFDRLKANDDHFINKHTTLLNVSKLCYNTRANIASTANREERESFKNYVIKHPTANSLSKIKNGFDFMSE